MFYFVLHSFFLPRLKRHNFHENKLFILQKEFCSKKIEVDILCYLVKHNQRPKKVIFSFHTITKFFKVMMQPVNYFSEYNNNNNKITATTKNNESRKFIVVAVRVSVARTGEKRHGEEKRPEKFHSRKFLFESQRNYKRK